MSKSRVAIISGIVVPIIIFLITPFWGAIFTDNKNINYQILEKKKVSELASDEMANSKIKLSYDGKDIRQGTFIVISIENSGKMPVKESDFNSNIFIDVKGGVVLFAQVVDTQPVNIPVELGQAGGKVSISPLLMNPGDKITVKVFSDSDIRVDSVYARILGVPEILRVDTPESSGLLVTTVRPLDGGGVLDKKVLPLNVKFLVPVTLILMLGVFICTMAATAFRGLTRFVFILLGAALYVSALVGYTVLAQYMEHNLGVSKLASFLICSAAMVVMAYTAFKIRTNLIQSFRGGHRVPHTYRVY